MVPRSKNVGLGKFWPNLEISEAFLTMGLEVVFGRVLCLVVSNFFCRRVSDLSFLSFHGGLQESNFSAFMAGTETVD